jgi:hypothetical protein
MDHAITSPPTFDFEYTRHITQADHASRMLDPGGPVFAHELPPAILTCSAGEVGRLPPPSARPLLRLVFAS